MRRRNLGWSAVFTDPFTGLRRPVSDVIGSLRIILKDDGTPIPRCGLDHLAHVKDAYSDVVIGPSVLRFAMRKLYSKAGGAQSTPFGTPFGECVTEGSTPLAQHRDRPTLNQP